MKRTSTAIQYCFLAITLGALLSVVPSNAQTPAPMQTPAPAPDRDTDLNRQQLAAFDQFLDSHQELAQELRKDPSLVNNQEFLASHSDLQHYLEQHPEVREGLTQNPNAVLNQEQRFDRREDRQEDRRPDQDQRQDRDMDRGRDLDRDRDHRVGDSDVTRGELKNMDAFMDGHPEIAEQLRKDPSLVNNKKFVADHPALQQFLANHPGVREEYKENPNAFMNREGRFDQREDRQFSGDRDVTRGELRNMDAFMDAHPEIAEQLKKDPSLVDNKQFVANHPALQQFLANHPGVREEYKENPNAFMNREERFDQREDRRFSGDRDVTRGELRNMDVFMDAHPEIAEQLKKDPSLVDNKQFVAGHPALQQFLANHPGVREEYKENPNAFMHQEQRFDRREDFNRRDRDVTGGELSSFHEFLQGHGTISTELSKNPSLATNKEYLANHPELSQYLTSHPKVNEELGENPQSFLKSSQQFESTTKPMPKPLTAPKTK